MTKSTLLAWLSACSLFLLLTGCNSDDQPNNTTSTNTNKQPPLCMAPWSISPNAITLTPNDASGPIQINLDAAENYVLVSQSNTNSENGTFTATPSGDLATLVLTSNTTNIIRTINLAFTTPTQGTYTSDSLGQGTVTLEYPPQSGCGPY